MNAETADAIKALMSVVRCEGVNEHEDRCGVHYTCPACRALAAARRVVESAGAPLSWDRGYGL